MITMLRADLVRLSTLRSSYAVPSAMFVLVAAITAATWSEAGSEGLTTATQLREPLTASTGIMVAVAMAVFAAMRVAGEYRYDTMSQRLLTSPRRSRLLAAILAFYSLLGLMVGAVALAIGLAIARPMLSADDRSMNMTPQIIAAVLLAVTCFSLIGVCCAVIFRSQPAAVLVIIGGLVVEKLMGMFIGDASAYLPYGLLTPLLQLEGATIAAGTAAAVLTSITLALIATTSLAFTRRDVTT